MKTLITGLMVMTFAILMSSGSVLNAQAPVPCEDVDAPECSGSPSE